MSIAEDKSLDLIEAELSGEVPESEGYEVIQDDTVAIKQMQIIAALERKKEHIHRHYYIDPEDPTKDSPAGHRMRLLKDKYEAMLEAYQKELTDVDKVIEQKKGPLAVWLDISIQNDKRKTAPKFRHWPGLGKISRREGTESVKIKEGWEPSKADVGKPGIELEIVPAYEKINTDKKAIKEAIKAGKFCDSETGEVYDYASIEKGPDTYKVEVEL